MDLEWPDVDEEILDDEVGRQAAARLRDQLELPLDESIPPLASRGELLEFSIEQKNLRDAALVTALNLSSEKSESILTNVEILRPGLRLTRQKGSIVCRAVCPVVRNAVFTHDGGISFGFSHRILEQIGRGPTGDLKCTLNLAKGLLRIRWGNASLGFTPEQRPAATFEDWELQSPTSRGRIDPDALKRALAYVRIAADRKNAISANIVSQGQARATTNGELAVFQTPALRGVELSIAPADVKCICWVLSRLHRGLTSLFETDSLYIIKDHLIELVIDKPKKLSVPDIPSVFSEPARNKLSVSPRDLMTNLPMFSTLLLTSARSKETLVELKYQLGAQSKLALTIRSGDGSSAVAEVEAKPVETDNELMDWHLKVAGNRLIAHLGNISDAGSIEFGVIEKKKGKVLALKRETDDFSARTFLSVHAD
jgi:hypothetical protein